MKFEVNNSPFNLEQVEQLNKLLPTLTESQKVWLSGYLAASFTSPVSHLPILQKLNTPAGIEQHISKEVTILYGSQTGNAQRLAKNAGRVLEENGFQVTVDSMNDFNPKQIKKVQNLLLFISTHGEGAPPDNAITFYEYLNGKRVSRLENLRYSVLALGDSSYEFFCQTGKDFDKKLEELGGIRINPRVDCDLDFEEPAHEWLDGVLRNLNEIQTTGMNEAAATQSLVTPSESTYSRSNPFYAEVIENINLNGKGSNKETRHLELSLEGSDLEFKPGDSLGIYPKNDPVLVEMLLEELKWAPDHTVTINKQGDLLTLKEALTSIYEISILTKPLLEKVVELTNNESLLDLISSGSGEKVRDYLEGRDVIDLIQDYGSWGESAQEFVSVLRKIPPRLYSIASSYTANPDEVHLTIGTLRYTAHGRRRKGVCSTFCAERIKIGDKIPIFIQSNENFRLPVKTNTPIIMVGPGTGVAPFRSFMQEWEEIGATGKSWLFYGDQHFMTDFLYQTEWKKFLKDGVLTRIDVAFSRDTEEKVYVQHRILENSKEFFKWLEDGAAIYICGDEKQMAKDVHQTLIHIIEKEGNMSREKAEEYLTNLQQERRYQRDVY